MIEQMDGTDEQPSTMLTFIDAEDGDADLSTSASAADEDGGRCSEEKHAACLAQLNSTFTDAYDVTKTHHIVPDLDDTRLDTICR